jgi:hypothetical protein
LVDGEEINIPLPSFVKFKMLMSHDIMGSGLLHLFGPAERFQ